MMCITLFINLSVSSFLLTNIIEFKKKSFWQEQKAEVFVLTNEHISNYVATIQDTYYLADNLEVEDLKDAVRVAYFYAKQMQKRIKELEDKISD